MIRRIVLIVLLLAAGPSEAGTVSLTSPLIFSDLPQGYYYDGSGLNFVAAVPMDCMVWIRTPGQSTNIDVSLKFGILNANFNARHGICITSTNDSFIEVRSVQYPLETGATIFQEGAFGTFNNFIKIGSIRGAGGNGLVLWGPAPDGNLGVQGNHIEVGQIIGSGASGILVAGPASCCNYLLVGPVEHNQMYGCYDERGGNTWVIVNSNTNGLRQAC